MTEAPSPIPPALGPLSAPNEEEVVAAFPALQSEALTLSWAAVAVGRQAAELEALARDGELVVIPGPWRLRQAYGRLAYVVPAWQLDLPRIRDGIPTIVQAAVARGWTSLELHHFMTTAPWPGSPTPAEHLEARGVAPVLALLRGEPLPAAPGLRHSSSRHLRCLIRR